MKESQLNNKTSIATNDYVRMVDENNNSVKIKKDSFMAAIRDALPSIISDGATGTGSVLSIINGALKTRTDANLASVLGVGVGDKHWHYLHQMTGNTPLEVNLSDVATQHGMDAQGLWIFGYGGDSSNPGRQSLYFYNSESSVWQRVSPPSQDEEPNVTITAVRSGVLSLTFANDWMWFGFRKL